MCVETMSTWQAAAMWRFSARWNVQAAKTVHRERAKSLINMFGNCGQNGEWAFFFYQTGDPSLLYMLTLTNNCVAVSSTDRSQTNKQTNFRAIPEELRHLRLQLGSLHTISFKWIHRFFTEFSFQCIRHQFIGINHTLHTQAVDLLHTSSNI